MKIQYDVVKISNDGPAYVATVSNPETNGRIGPAPSLKKLIEVALTPDGSFSPRVKAAFVAIEKMAKEFNWDDAKLEAALPVT